MTRIVLAAGALAAALHVGCATTPPPSPGAITVINGATFVCDRDSCRLVEPGQGVLFKEHP